MNDFPEAMKLKDPSSPLCSPCLVNAVLFMGCVSQTETAKLLLVRSQMFSDHASIFAVPNDPASRGTLFMDEALRLWALEDERTGDSGHLSDRALRESARGQIMSSASAIATHTDKFRAAFGRKHFSIYMTQVSMTVVWSVMDMLREAEVRDVFHWLLVKVSVTARRALICRGFSRMILGTLQQRGLEHLLQEASKTLLRLNAVDAWGPDDHQLFKSVTYPNVVVASEEDRSPRRHGGFAAKVGKFRLGRRRHREEIEQVS